MSILGYSSSYFLPKYWANTPFYGEKLIPLLDYILSTDYVHTEQLATAFYNIESKYKNTADLPIEQIEAIIEESGYGYIRELLGQDEDSIRLLVYLLVLIHQLKGSKKGIELVLSLLKSPEEGVKIEYVGNLEKRIGNEITGFSPNSYIAASNFNLGEDSFSLNFQIRTGDSFETEQCIASAPNYGFYLGIDTNGRIVLKIGEANSSIAKRGWQEIGGETVFKSDRVLERNTLYYINFEFSGYDYSVRVSQDGKKYTYYKVVSSSTPLGISNDVLFIGIDNSENTYRYPFLGYMYMNLMTVSSNDIKITQWFEKFPVGEENTFSIESGIDGEVISNEFFTNFAKFVRNYVYPTLESFRARLTLKGEITFIPYVREQVTYVASDENTSRNWQDFIVADEDGIPYEVKNDGEYETYKVQFWE